MSGITADQLAKITSFPKLVSLLRDNLDWPIDKDYELADVIYEYDPAELGLKPDEIAKIREISQLRPLVTNQPWGIFFISFEEKTISVSVLRRMLRNLVFNKRGSAKSSDKQAWAKNDLIFAANFGKSGERELAFVHFSDEGATNDLPVLKVLGWNAKDTVLHNGYVSSVLDEKLRWPDDEKNVATWRKQWSSAFEVKHNEAINTSKDLAIRLAALATNIRARANQLLEAESDKGPMQKMLAAFRKNLIQDLDEDGFADMFAQTISYGLLAAHISRPSGGIVADNLVDMVPKTNPFLRELFSTFLSLGGRDQRKGMDYDELGVRDVVDMLAAANMEAVLRDFGDRNPKEDPVIHFYELFLKEYDPEKRMQRGVFYTPRPVVNFIVRGVDEILRTEFGLPLGLADTTTWSQLAAKNDKIIIPPHIKPETPFVQILDPATGTGTFLVEAIDLIHTTMETHWKAEGRSVKAIKDAWNDYVPQHLLPRLTGFELMMAPYAIAHMKIGLKLTETGYTFGSDERAHIFLTNTLAPSTDANAQKTFELFFPALADEVKAVNSVKRKQCFSVIVGNPPYASISSNTNPWIKNEVNQYLSIDGLRLEEKSKRNHLQNDYIKFIRFAELECAKSPISVFSFITSNSYLDGRTLRGLRYNLMRTFSKLKILNLWGDSKKRNASIDDKNVFDITEGVAIITCVRSDTSHPALVTCSDLQGNRERKYNSLSATPNDIIWKSINPNSPDYLFVQSDVDERDEYFRLGPALDKIFAVSGAGMKSNRDDFAIHVEPNVLIKKMNDFASISISDQELRKRYDLKDNYVWKLPKARADFRQRTISKIKIAKLTYRPFDDRFVYFDKAIVFNPRVQIMRHMIGGDNLALVSIGQNESKVFNHVFVSGSLVEIKMATHYGASIVFPLRTKANSPTDLFSEEEATRSNLTDAASSLLHMAQVLVPVPKVPEEQVFYYIYSILHSPGYRLRYRDQFLTNFPRIPTPSIPKLFDELVIRGRQLVALHLLQPDEAPVLKQPDIRLAGTGEVRVEKRYPQFENGKVMINATRWFEDVPKDTWVFHVGGYQVLEKWMKDRAEKGGKNPKPGRVLTDEDILHYRRIVTSLTETRRLMAEIDKTIEAHGGWPGAFGGANGKA